MANKAYKFRIYPNTEQQILFAKTFGCVRFVYNRMLADKIKHYEEILRGRTDNKYLIDIKSYNIVYSFKEVRGLIDYYLENRMNYYQQYDWKEKDLKTEEKLDELLAQTIKLSIQGNLKKNWMIFI